MARITDAIDNIVTAINAASLSQTFTAVRKHIYSYSSHEELKLTCYVLPGTVSYESLNRNSTRADHTVDVVVRKKLNKTIKTDQVDDLLTLMDELADLLLRNSPGSGRKVMGISQEEYFDQEALHSESLFVSTLTLSIRDQF